MARLHPAAAIPFVGLVFVLGVLLGSTTDHKEPSLPVNGNDAMAVARMIAPLGHRYGSYVPNSSVCEYGDTGKVVIDVKQDIDRGFSASGDDLTSAVADLRHVGDDARRAVAGYRP